MAKIKPLIAASIVFLLIATAGGVVASYVLVQQPQRSPNVVIPPAGPAAAKLSDADLAKIGPMDSPVGTVVGAFNAAAAGNADALIACFDHPTAGEQDLLRQMARIMAVGEELRTAVAARWGDEAAQGLLQSVGLHFGASRQAMQNAVAAFSGDTAAVQVQPMGEFKMVREGNLWKMSSDMMNGAPASEMAAMDAAIPRMRLVIDRIKAGAFGSIQDIRLAMRSVLDDQTAGH